jgi:lysophospholipase L1-like esterase
MWLQDLVRFPAAIGRARRLAHRVPPLPPRPAQPERRVLIAGDSLALGVGARSPQSPFAARIAAEFPAVGVDSVARVGARAADLAAQLERAPQSRYDAILITIGGNDVIRLTRWGRLSRGLNTGLALARRMADLVIAATSANVGGAPLFPWPLCALFDRRSRALRALMAQACRAHDAVMVNYIFDREEDPFGRDSARYYAADRVHPTDAAYAACYEMLKRGAPLERVLACAQSAPAR